MLLTWIAEVADETSTPEPGDRPFTNASMVCDDLAPVVEAFLAAGEPQVTPLRVWTSRVGGPGWVDEDEEVLWRSFGAAETSVAAQDASKCKACSDGEPGSAA
ncbi:MULTISPECIES: hypothetical protein [unclassified Streptomyces]|uniref:hypothetical protein n=1 Tax=unclassified Streptomyces TaxID=2593676 RepID=UPI000BE27CF7|nr:MULTISPECIES: hypothetical protein [unclassified Streptomyces]